VVVLYGTGKTPVPLTFIDGKKTYTVTKPFEGVIGNLNRRMLQTESAWMKEELGKFQTAQPCEVCEGKRLKPEALCVKLGDADISSITRLPVGEAVGWFAGLEASWVTSRSRSPRLSSRKSTSGWVSQQCGAGLPQSGSHQRHAVGRRIAAHPAGLADWQRAFGRALCAG
jgi:excinuclease UvrABC ATPase subunit